MMRYVSDVSDLFSIVASDPVGSTIASLRYLTTWTIILLIASKFTRKYVDLVFLTGFVLVCSLYITYVKPGYLKYTVNNKEYRITKFARRFVNLFAHLVPFLAAVLLFDKVDAFKVANAILIVLIYNVLFDVRFVYDVSGVALVAIVALWCYVYTLYVFAKTN